MTALLERPVHPMPPARLRMACPSPDVVELLLVRLVDRYVDGDATTANAVGDFVTVLVPGCWDTFESLAAAAETIAKLEAGTFDWAALPWDVNPDRVNDQVRGDYAELLDELTEAAMRSLMGGAR